MTAAEIREQYEFFKKNREAFFDRYYQKYLVIKDFKVLAAYSTLEETAKSTLNEFGLSPGDYLVQQVLPEQEEPVRAVFSKNRLS